MLNLERLEDRCTPSVAYTFLDSGSNVLLSGSTAGAGISINATSGGNVTIDGADTGVPVASVASCSLTGNGGGNTLTLDDADHVWTVSGVSQGGVTGMPYALTFSGIESLVGGPGADTFSITTNTSGVTGTLNGGSGINRLTYTGRSLGVLVNLASGTASATGGIFDIQNVTGTSGNDVLIGDAGNNVLDSGTGGNDILVGQGGNNTLTSHGSGHALMIGGTGANTLIAGTTGGDLMIGESTNSYDTNLTALNAILTEWSRSDVTYATKIAHIQGTLSGGLNGSYYLNSSTIHHGTVHSSLLGGSNLGLNWYIVAFASDVLTHKSGETITVA